MAKKQYRLERNKNKGVTEIYHINGFLLGEHELPTYNGQETKAVFSDYDKTIKVGMYSTPFAAAKALVEIWESKAGEREERRLKEIEDWMNKPLVKIMKEDYDKLENKPSEFMRFYRQNIWDYEERYPNLVV